MLRTIEELKEAKYRSVKGPRTETVSYLFNDDLYYVTSWHAVDDNVQLRKCPDHWVLMDHGGTYANQSNSVMMWRYNLKKE